MHVSSLDDLMTVINQHSMENGSNTSDWILAEYLLACLRAFDVATNARDRLSTPPQADRCLTGETCPPTSGGATTDEREEP